VYRDSAGNSAPISIANSSALSDNEFGPNSCVGWNCVLVSMQGFVAASTTLEVEVIYHVEGLEAITTGASAQYMGNTVAFPMGGRVGPHDPILAMAAEKINAMSGESWIYS